MDFKKRDLKTLLKKKGEAAWSAIVVTGRAVLAKMAAARGKAAPLANAAREKTVKLVARVATAKKAFSLRTFKRMGQIVGTLALTAAGMAGFYALGVWGMKKVADEETPHVFVDNGDTIRVFPERDTALLNKADRTYFKVAYSRNYSCEGVTLFFKQAADGSAGGLNSVKSCRDISQPVNAENKAHIDAAARMKPYLDKARVMEAKKKAG